MNKPKQIKKALKNCVVGINDPCEYNEKSHLVDCLHAFNVPEEEQKEILDAFDNGLINWCVDGSVNSCEIVEQLTIQ